MTRVRRTFVGLMIVASLAACQIIAGIDDDHFTVAATSDEASIVDGSVPKVDASPPPPEYCQHTAPPPSTSGKNGGVGAKPYVFVIDNFDFSGKTDAGEVAGYDLDGVCTCFARSTKYDGKESCSTGSSTPVCDADGGVDNSLARLGASGGGLGSDIVGNLQKTQRGEFACGRQALVLVLSEYDGTANDDQVSVAGIVSYGIYNTLEGLDGGLEAGADDSGPPTSCDFSGPGPLTSDGGFAFQPKLNGRDVWTTTGSSLLAESKPEFPMAISPLTGYVTNYELVVNYGDDKHTLPVSIVGRELDLGTPFLTAHLVPVDEDNQPITLAGDGGPEKVPAAFALRDGTIGGRVNVTQLLGAVGGLVTRHLDDGGPGHLCADSTFPFARGVVCQAVDIETKKGNDFLGRSCDAISVAFAFSATRAHVTGIHMALTDSTSDCDAGYEMCTP